MRLAKAMVGVLTMHLTGIVAFHKPMIKITKRYHKVASKIVFGAFFTAASLSFWSNWSINNLASWIKVGFGFLVCSDSSELSSTPKSTHL